LEYVLACHGKRLRPTLALLSGLATGGVTDLHVDLGIVVEMIHLATLVHDDIMDGASQRRGQATAAHRWGAEISVLVGDCLFAHALKLCATRFPQDISREISAAVCEVCSGEILQTQRRFDLSLGLDDYLRIIRMKTGELFRIPCELGARINGASEAAGAGLRRYGESLGVAYQIYDDILDLLGSEEETGKTLGTDLERGKITLPLLYLLESVSGPEHEALCESLLHGQANGAGSRAIIEMAAERGALRRSIATLSNILAEAAQGLAALPPGEGRDSLALIPASLEQAVAELSLRV
jgi:octaprenyl-diphosphate synthase